MWQAQPMLPLKSEYVLVVSKLKASIYCAPCNPLPQVTRELLVDPLTGPSLRRERPVSITPQTST